MKGTILPVSLKVRYRILGTKVIPVGQGCYVNVHVVDNLIKTTKDTAISRPHLTLGTSDGFVGCNRPNDFAQI